MEKGKNNECGILDNGHLRSRRQSDKMKWNLGLNGDYCNFLACVSSGGFTNVYYPVKK